MKNGVHQAEKQVYYLVKVIQENKQHRKQPNLPAEMAVCFNNNIAQYFIADVIKTCTYINHNP